VRELAKLWRGKPLGKPGAALLWSTAETAIFSPQNSSSSPRFISCFALCYLCSCPGPCSFFSSTCHAGAQRSATQPQVDLSHHARHGIDMEEVSNQFARVGGWCSAG
jgi:hypothetical protein